MREISGLRIETPENLVFGEGVAYANIDVDALESDPGDDLTAWELAIADAIPLGATRGDATFNPNRTLRQIEVNGTLGRVRELVRRESVEPTLTVTLLEQTPENLQMLIAGARRDYAGRFHRITGGEIGQNSFIDNIALAATMEGSNEPIVFVLFNALVVDSVEFPIPGTGEMAVTVTFVGHFPLDNPKDESQVWRLYRPIPKNGNNNNGE